MLNNQASGILYGVLNTYQPLTNNICIISNIDMELALIQLVLVGGYDVISLFATGNLECMHYSWNLRCDKKVSRSSPRKHSYVSVFTIHIVPKCCTSQRSLNGLPPPPSQFHSASNPTHPPN